MRRRGHFCWSCGGRRPNERFSASGHRRHLCRDCSRLPATELEFRQAARNIERLLHDGMIKRKRRTEFESFLAHANPLVRSYAKRIHEADAEMRSLSRAMWEQEEAAGERAAAAAGEGEAERWFSESDDDTDVPF